MKSTGGEEEKRMIKYQMENKIIKKNTFFLPSTLAGKRRREYYFIL